MYVGKHGEEMLIDDFEFYNYNVFITEISLGWIFQRIDLFCDKYLHGYMLKKVRIIDMNILH